MTTHIKRRPFRDQLTLCGFATDEYCVGEFTSWAHPELCASCVAEAKNERVLDALEKSEPSHMDLIEGGE